MREVLADGIEIWFGDCLEIMPKLQAVDHVITDPPYEDEMHRLHKTSKLRRTDGGPERQELGFEGITKIRPDVIRAIKAINQGWLLAFCNVEGVGAWRADLIEAGAKFKTTCIWVKPDSTPQMNGQGPALGFECITTSWFGKGHSSWNGGGRRGVFSHLTNNSERDGEHPTEKPVSLKLELVTLFTDPGQVVLDPFMGSGTTGVACVRSGRRFIGIEQDDRHFDTACRRIYATLKQPDLFITTPQPRKQDKFELFNKSPILTA